MPEHEPMLEVLIRRHYREHDLHDLGLGGRRGPDLRHRRLHPRRPAHPPGVDRRHVRRDRRRRRAPSSSRSRSEVAARARRPAGRRRPLPATGPRLPSDVGGDDAPSWPTSSGPCRSSPTYAASWSPSRPGAGRPVDLLHLPAGAAPGWRLRGRPGARRAPDGRPPAQPLAAPELPPDPASTRPRTCCSTSAWPRTTRRTAGWSRWPRSVSSPSSATTSGAVVGLPHAERAVENCLEAIRRTRTARGSAGNRLDSNHVWVQVWPVVDADVDQLTGLQRKITPLTDGAGIAEVLAQGRVADPDGGTTPLAIRFHARPGAGVTASIEPEPTEPLAPLDEYTSKVLRARRRGLVYPYELQEMLTGPGGSLVEHDLDDTGVLVPVERPRGLNKAGLIVARGHHPDGAAPRGRQPRRPLRRPDQGARCGLRAGVLAAHRRPRPRRAAAGPGGVVRPLGRRAHLDGLRHREHGLGRGRPQADHRVHPGRRRDQRRRRRASTSGRSRTGTPRRRCSCTPRGSW